MTNALQQLIHNHCQETGATIASIAEAAGLSRQTVSAIANRDTPGAIPQKRTLEGLARGMGLSLETVERAAAKAASQVQSNGVEELRLAVLMDSVRGLDDSQLRILLATARAMKAV